MAAEGNAQLGNYFRGYAKVIVLGKEFYLLKPMFVDNIFIWASQNELRHLNLLGDPEAQKVDAKISMDGPGVQTQLEQWFSQDETMMQIVADAGNSFQKVFGWIEQINVFDLAILSNEAGVQLKAGIRIQFKDQSDANGIMQPGIGLNDFLRIKEFEVTLHQTAGNFSPSQLDSAIQLAQSKIQTFLSEGDELAQYLKTLHQNTHLESIIQKAPIA